MQKVALILPVLFFTQLTAQAQDWQLFNSGRDRFFKSGKPPVSAVYGGGEIKAFHADTVEMAGADSVFQLFGTMEAWSTGSCLNIDVPGWLGEKMILQPDGDNLLFNYEQDTIRIRTRALLNEPYVMYRYANGNYVQGKVVSTGVGSVTGIPDSIKTVELLVRNTAGAVVNNVLNGAAFMLSKNNGLVNTFSWYNFPFDSSLYIATNAGRLTRGAVYDMQVGDVFQYFYSCNNPGTEEEHVITGKSFSAGMDSVIYTKRISEKRFIPPLGDDSQMTSRTETVAYGALDELYFRAYPEQTTLLESITWYAMRQGVYNQRISLAWEIKNWEKDSCYHNPFEPVYNDYVAIEGCGVFTSKEFDPTFSGNPADCSRSLTYFKKGNETFGAPRIINSVEKILPEQNDFTIFPNPAASMISIAGNNLKTITISNIMGVTLFEKDIAMQSGSEIKLDISALPSGLYFIKSEGAVRRFIKN